MVILGILGAIGYGIYTNFIGDARDTALDQNIQSAAAELQSVLALEPTLAAPAARSAGLVTAMTNRTNFVWDSSWDFQAGDEPDTIRYEFITKGAPAAYPVSGTAPSVNWLVDGQSAVRIHITNPEGEWRCALLILKPSTTVITGFGTATLTADIAAAKAAELRGIWYDGGSTGDGVAGLHDCSPVGASSGFGAYAAATNPNGCGQTGTVTFSDQCLPTDAQTWEINALTAQLDTTSSAVPGARTLHRSASSLDSNA